MVSVPISNGVQRVEKEELVEAEGMDLRQQFEVAPSTRSMTIPKARDREY